MNMATTAPTPIPAGPITSDRIPTPGPEVESDRPLNGKFGYVPKDFPAHPDAKGNRGMSTAPPRDAFAENADPNYVPFDNLRRRGA